MWELLFHPSSLNLFSIDFFSSVKLLPRPHPGPGHLIKFSPLLNFGSVACDLFREFRIVSLVTTLEVQIWFCRNLMTTKPLPHQPIPLILLKLIGILLNLLIKIGPLQTFKRSGLESHTRPNHLWPTWLQLLFLLMEVIAGFVSRLEIFEIVGLFFGKSLSSQSIVGEWVSTFLKLVHEFGTHWFCFY